MGQSAEISAPRPGVNGQPGSGVGWQVSSWHPVESRPFGTIPKEVSSSLSKLVQDIQMGEIGLPDIQRPFVWKNNRVRDLFDSMYRGFPVGYLLFWANGGDPGQRQIGTEEKQKIPRLLIVDGQQRLTSLYAVLQG